MACDIHLYTEVRIGGVWHLYQRVSCQRNYELFSLMAGVGAGPTLYEARHELPEGVSPIVRIWYEYWGENAHTLSWLSSEEVYYIGTHFALDRTILGYILEVPIQDFFNRRDEIPNEIEDFRWVFWFES